MKRSVEPVAVVELQVVDQLDQRGRAGQHDAARSPSAPHTSRQSRCSLLYAATRTFIMIRLAMPPGAYITMNRKIEAEVELPGLGELGEQREAEDHQDARR